jgi:hypothetical protein
VASEERAAMGWLGAAGTSLGRVEVFDIGTPRAGGECEDEVEDSWGNAAPCQLAGAQVGDWCVELRCALMDP